MTKKELTNLGFKPVRVLLADNTETTVMEKKVGAATLAYSPSLISLLTHKTVISHIKEVHDNEQRALHGCP